MNDDLPSDFDPEAYLAMHIDVAAARIDPTEHYLKYGRGEGRAYRLDTSAELPQTDPSNQTINDVPHDFDPSIYLALNPDVEALGVDPINHFIHHGNGRSYKAPSDEQIRSNNDSRLKMYSDQTEAQRKKPGCPEAFGYKVYSQFDEDGIVAEIFRRIGTRNKIFVEFGAELGLENNCRNLLENGWTGLWIEGRQDFGQILIAKHRKRIKSGDLKFISAYVTAENINSLISSSGLAGEIDLLSIDIDSIDYYIWDAMSVISPRVVIMEHNSFAPPVDYVMPYDAAFRHYHGAVEFGSSIVANVSLANKKGYSLVSTGLYSDNGFYVRNDLLGDKFPGPYDAESNFRKHVSSRIKFCPGPPSAGEIWR